MKIAKFPVTKEFQLNTDPDGKATVVIRQAREGENTDREEMFGTVRRIYDMNDDFVDDVTLETSENKKKTRRREAYLVLGSVTGIEDEDGKELFKSKDSVDGKSVRNAMSEPAFSLACNMLPPETIEEIMEYVYEVNPMWDRFARGE